MNIHNNTKNAFIAALTTLVLAGCSGESKQSSSESSTTLALDKDTPIAYVQRSVSQTVAVNRQYFEQAVNSESQTPLELYSPYFFNPGAKLIERSGLDVGSVSQELLTAYFKSSSYDVKDLNVSPDGRYLVFAAHGPTFHPTDYSWNIYEYDFDTKTIRRIIRDDALANAGQDTNPTYTFDGHIVFSSDRAAGNPDSPVLNVVEDEEYCYKIGPKERPSLLHSMTTQGEDILQLTYGINHDTHPTTMKDGRVAFIRWSYSYEVMDECLAASKSTAADLLAGKSSSPWGLSKPTDWSIEAKCAYAESTPVGDVMAKNNYTLLRISADGKELEQLYDTVSIDATDEQFIYLDRIVQAENGQLAAVLKHKFSDSLGGDLVAMGSPDAPATNTVFGNVAPKSLVDNNFGLYPGQLSKNGWYSAMWPYRDGSSRLLVSWSQCLTSTNGVNDYCDNVVANNGEGSEYGIWLYDVNSRSRSPIVAATSDTFFEDVVMSRPHTGLDFPYEPFNRNYVDNLDDSQIVCNYPEPANNPPLANAGADQSVYIANQVILDGSASSDPEGASLSYSWTLLSKPQNSAATLDNLQNVAPQFTADLAGTYRFQLIVNDGVYDSPADTVTVLASAVVVNAAPVADAGPDQQVLVGAKVSLNGSGSSDPNGDSLSYQWSLLASPAGASLNLLSDTSVSTPSFDAAVVGVYRFQLVVSDGELTSAPDTVVVTVNYPNRPPVAEAGNNQQVAIGSTLLLNGSASSDPDGDTLSYQWTVVSGPSGASLVDATTVRPGITLNAYGSYLIQLIVSDGVLNSVPDTVTLEVINTKPVANAGPDRSAEQGESIVLNGTGSYDLQGSELSYVWVITSQPEDSNATLSNATTANPIFTGAVNGAYSLQLVVNDGLLDSDPDSTTITVEAANRAPVANAGNDQKVTIGGTYTLDGSGSTDSDGDALTYQWSLISPETGAIANPTAVRPTITINEYGSYVVELIVNDGELDSMPDRVNLVFDNVKPLANAGLDQSAVVGSTVVLDGSASTDVNGDPLSYSWTLVDQPSNSTATLLNSETISPSLVTDQQGSYTIQLVVNDGLLDSDPDLVVVTTPNTKPVANAGADMAVFLGGSASLNGSASYDADGDALTYRWSLLSKASSASQANLVNATAVNASLDAIDVYGDYVVQLIVNDGFEDSLPDTVVLSTQNLAPVANAGVNTTIDVGQNQVLDGSASYDPEGDVISYLWSLIAVPEGSDAVLNNPSAATPDLSPDIEGLYVAQLIVNDGQLDSVPDTVALLAKKQIDGDDVSDLCQRLVRQSATISLDFPSTKQSYPAGSPGRCDWQYTNNQGRDFIQGMYKQSALAELPPNAVVCSSSLMASGGEETLWNFDDHFFLTLGDKVLVSSEKASVMDGLVEQGSTLAYGEGPYVFDFAGIRNLPNSPGTERYCLGHPRIWDIINEDNPSCRFPQTEQTGVFNIDIPDEAFADISATIVNQDKAEFSLIVTGDNDNQIDCQHTGIELNWNIEYVLKP